MSKTFNNKAALKRMEREEKWVHKLVEKQPMKIKKEFLLNSALIRPEAIMKASKTEIDDWTTAGCIATGFRLWRKKL